MVLQGLTGYDPIWTLAVNLTLTFLPLQGQVLASGQRPIGPRPQLQSLGGEFQRASVGLLGQIRSTSDPCSWGLTSCSSGNSHLTDESAWTDLCSVYSIQSTVLLENLLWTNLMFPELHTCIFLVLRIKGEFQSTLFFRLNYEKFNLMFC